jgi:hypothetical protein
VSVSARLLYVCLVMASAILTGCTASYPTKPTKAPAVALQVHYNAATGFSTVGTSYSFSAYTLDRDGAYQNVTTLVAWSSSNSDVLQPTASWFFRAVAPGAAQVTARYGELESSVWMVVIHPELRAFPFVAVTTADPQVIGRQARSTATLRQSATASQVVTEAATWLSSDPTVATVDRGLITAVGAGTTQITVSYDDLSAWYWLSVRPRS